MPFRSLAIIAAACALALSACSNTDEIARMQAAQAYAQAEQARLDAERARAEAERARSRTIVVREPREEIFEPVRETPSTIDDPLYGRN